MSTPVTVIPFHRPSIGDEEIREVTEVLRSGWLTTGPKTAQFESEFATYVDSRHALAVSSGRLDSIWLLRPSASDPVMK